MKHQISKITHRLLPALLLVVVIALVQPWVCAQAAQEDGPISLSSSNPEENKTYEVENMVPGSSYTQTYRVVTESKNKSVGFQVVASDGSAGLAEVLQVTVKRMDTEEVMYSGFLKDMAWVEWDPSSTDGQELVYEVTVFLDTAVDNSYQGQKAALTLNWRLESTFGAVLTSVWFWVGAAVLLIGAAVVTIVIMRKRNIGPFKNAVRISTNMIWAIVLVLSLCTTSFALAWHIVSVEENVFSTGTVKINLNDGKPVFNDSIHFEPGMIVEKTFTVANEGSVDVFFRLWVSNVEGELAEEMTIEIKDGKKTIYEGTLGKLAGKKAAGASAELAVNETKELTVIMYLPEESRNGVQGTDVFFDLNCDAVQHENNSGKKYG